MKHPDKDDFFPEDIDAYNETIDKIRRDKVKDNLDMARRLVILRKKALQQLATTEDLDD